MGQIKIYGLKSNLNQHREIISEAIHNSLVEAFSFPQDKKFQRFIGLDKDDFIYQDGRTENYIIIEVIMFDGRSPEAKKQFILGIYENITKALGWSFLDIEVTLIESPKENWGIRGMVASEMSLNYKVEV